MPCKNCKRTGRSCTISINSTALMPVFVSGQANTRAKVNEPGSSQEYQTVVHLPQSVGLKEHDRAFPYFFMSFLPMNMLANDGSMNTELLMMAKASSALRYAVQAVATLHRDQQDQISIISSIECRPKYSVLQAYGRAVRSMQSLITSGNFLGDPSALWTTFILGLFEVCN
jgi:hypothetical protein